MSYVLNEGPSRHFLLRKLWHNLRNFLEGTKCSQVCVSRDWNTQSPASRDAAQNRQLHWSTTKEKRSLWRFILRTSCLNSAKVAHKFLIWFTSTCTFQIVHCSSNVRCVYQTPINQFLGVFLVLTKLTIKWNLFSTGRHSAGLKIWNI